MENNQNKAASNRPILEWILLKLGPCSGPGVKVIREQAQTLGLATTLAQQIPTFCPNVFLLLKTGSVGLENNIVGPIKNHFYVIDCSSQGSPGKDVQVVAGV